MTVSKITTPVTPLELIEKTNEIIDNLGQGGGGLSYSATCPAITISSGIASWSVTHNLGTTSVIAMLYNSSGAKQECNIVVNSANAITVSFKASSNVTAGSYTIVVFASGGSAVSGGDSVIGESKYMGAVFQADSRWLVSDGTWYSGSTYSTFYDLAVDGIGNDFAAGKIVASTDTYGKYDLVVNTTNQTFRLPLLDGSESIISNEYESVALPADNTVLTAPANGWYNIAGVGKNVRLWNAYNGSTNGSTSGDAMVSCYASKGQRVTIQYASCDISYGWCFFRFVYARGNGSLYFKVME
ncbi:MAG: hypothetical protein II244_05985 [Clostridia bacterium]|nr:hypothetical protein [Clostridia bacterium]